MTDRWRVGANLATLANGLLGVGAILYTLAGNKPWAMLLVVMAIGFDGLDGLLSRRSARPMGRFGRIADSVADAISFGIAPAVFLAIHTSDTGLWAPYALATLAVAVVYVAAAFARLTYFTVRAHGLPYFLGVPTPESTLALVVLLLFHETPAFAGISPLGVAVGAAILAGLMVVPIPYPKLRRGAPLRGPSTVTAIFAALCLVPLQFRPGPSTPLGLVVEITAWGMLAGVIVYYVIGPFTVGRPNAAPD